MNFWERIAFRNPSLLKLSQIIWFRIKEYFGLDKRSLALFRICIAFTTLLDLYDRATDLEAHYTDNGILSRYITLLRIWNEYWISIYFFSGTFTFTAIIFVINAIVITMMIVGYKTRLSTFLTYFFLISIQSRNFLTGHGGDCLHRILLLFGIFLPLGDCFSIDAFLSKKKKGIHSKEDYQYLSMGTVALLVQVFTMYWSAHTLKTGAPWRETYTATWLALQLDFFRRPLGDFLLLFPNFLKLSTWGVVKWQGTAHWIYFIPIYTGPIRTFVSFGFFVMHLTFYLCLKLDLFGWITMSLIPILLPGWFWETFVFRPLSTKERINTKFYFDEHCSFCLNAKRFLEIFLLIPETKVLPLKRNLNIQFREKSGYHMNSNETSQTIHSNSWLIVEDPRGKIDFNFGALKKLAQVSPLLYPFRLLIDIIPQDFIENLFSFVHNHNSQDLEKNFQRTFKPKIKRFKKIRRIQKIFWFLMSNYFMWYCMTLIIGYNAVVHGFSNWAIDPKYYPVLLALRLDQSWSMFAPAPSDLQWWYNIEANLQNGTKVELFRNGALFTHIPNPFSWDKPDPSTFVTCFKNHRWFKYFENGLNTHPYNQDLRQEFGRWVCREYNKIHHDDQRLIDFSIHWVSEHADTQKFDGTRIPGNKMTLWVHKC